MVETDAVMEQFNDLDKNALMGRMMDELPMISGEMGMTPVGIAFRTGLDKERLSLMAQGKRKMRWSEYLSILFLLWDDDKGRVIAEDRGLFPDALKNAMSLNRNLHEENREKSQS